MQEQNRSSSMINVGRIIFSNFEKNILRELVDEHREILECKKNDWRSIKMKTETWNAIAEEFNSQPGVNHKDCKQLKKCWENMKARAKKALNKDIIEIPRFVEELEAQGIDNAVSVGVSSGVGITGATISGAGVGTNSGGSIKVEPLHNRLYVEADHPYDGGGHSHDGTIGGGAGPGGGGGASTPGGTVVVGSVGGTPGTPGGGATVVSIIGPGGGGGGGGGHLTNNTSNHSQLHNHNPAQHLQNTFGHQTVTVLECPDDDGSPPPSITVPVSGGAGPSGIFSMSNGEMCSPNSILTGDTASQVVLVKMQQEQHEIHMLMMKRKLDYAAAEHKAKMDVLQIQHQYWALQCEELMQKKYPSPSNS